MGYDDMFIADKCMFGRCIIGSLFYFYHVCWSLPIVLWNNKTIYASYNLIVIRIYHVAYSFNCKKIIVTAYTFNGKEIIFTAYTFNGIKINYIAYTFNCKKIVITA